MRKIRYYIFSFEEIFNFRYLGRDGLQKVGRWKNRNGGEELRKCGMGGGMR